MKKTVAIEIDGNVGYYGCDCAARILGWSTKDVESAKNSADKENARKEREAAQELRRRIQNHPLYIKAQEIQEEGRRQYKWLKDFPAELVETIRNLQAQATAEVTA